MKILLSLLLSFLRWNAARVIFPRVDDFKIDCKLEDGTTGMCRNLRECPSALEPREKVKTCYFEKAEQFVCCPDTPKIYVADEVCSSYYPDYNPPDYDDNYTAVIHGIPTNPNEFPFMVALGFANLLEWDQYNYKWGGALIAPEFVLTAAHCLSVEPVVVLPGGVNLYDTSAKVYEIERVIVHPQYEPKLAYHDIALLKLKSPIGGLLLPACISGALQLENQSATAIGYGHQVFGGRSSDRLLKAPLSIVNNKVYAPHFKDTEELPFGLLDGQLCAQDSRNGRDTCQGDSGGPLVLRYTRKTHQIPYIVGITSFGIGCTTEAPGVYTRVANYLDWIEPIVWPRRQSTRT